MLTIRRHRRPRKSPPTQRTWTSARGDESGSVHGELRMDVDFIPVRHVPQSVRQQVVVRLSLWLVRLLPRLTTSPPWCQRPGSRPDAGAGRRWWQHGRQGHVQGWRRGRGRSVRRGPSHAWRRTAAVPGWRRRYRDIGRLARPTRTTLGPLGVVGAAAAAPLANVEAPGPCALKRCGEEVAAAEVRKPWRDGSRVEYWETLSE